MNGKGACRSVAWAITATALLASCTDQGILGGDWHGVARIVLNPASVQLNDGDRAPVTVRALDAAGEEVAVSSEDFQLTWASSDPAVAQIEGSGATVHIRAVGAGNARVTVNVSPRASTLADTKLTTSTDVLTFPVAAAARAQAGDDQVGVVGQKLPENLAVSVLDRQDRPVAGVKVSFATTDDGAFEPATATTDASGIARTSWRLGTRQGTQTATASIPNGTAMQFRASASPAAPESVQPVSNGMQSGTVGRPLPNRLQARITDRFGNGIGGLPATWQVVSGAGSVIPGTALTDSTGLAEATWVLGSAAGVQSARVQIAGMMAEFNALAQPTEPSRIIKVSGDGQSAAVGSRLPNPLVARVLDTHGNAIGGATVSWRVTSGGGSVDAATSTSDASGYARTTWTFGSVAGEGTVAGSIGTAETSFSGTATSSSPPPSNPPPTNPPPTNPPPAPTAPSRVTDLRVVSTTSNSITLTWTAVSDGNGGSAAYAIRAGSPTIAWSSASASERTVAAGTTGQMMSYTYTGLPAGTNYQFQMVSYRGTLNVNAVFGERSNIVSTATPAPPAPVVASVTVTPSSHTFSALGQTQQLTAVARDAAGATLTGVRFTWSSSNPSIVSVDSMGRMTARAAGSALVIACAATCSRADTTSVVVQPPSPPRVTSVTASPSTHTFTRLGDTRLVTATARDAAGAIVSNAALRWTSSNPSIVSVDSMGQMTARAVGTASIIVTSVCCSVADTVTAVVDPVTPPPGNGTAYFSDNFDNGQKTNANGFGWGSSGSNIVVSSEHAYSGRYSLRFRFGPDADGEDSSAEQRFSITPNAASAPKEVWFEYMLRVPDNFTHRNSSGPDNNKVFAAWAEDYRNSTTETLVVAEYELAGDGSSFLRVSSAMADGYETRNPDRVQTARGTLFNTSMRGRWIRIRIHVKSQPNASVFDIWRDNELIARLPADYSITAPGWTRGYIRNGYLLGWANSGFTEVTDFYIDDFKVYTTNPGW